MPEPLRALIVDDEPLARRELRALLAEHPEVVIVAEAGSADEADAELTALRASGDAPDVVFLDIQMPGRTGFEWLEALDSAPEVVFVTAYDEHALDAFRVSALDYLLKPVEPERLADAVERLGRRDAPEDSAGASASGALGPDSRVFVKDGARMHLVRLGDVRLFESVGNYTRLLFTAPNGKDESPLVLRSLSALEARLDPVHFARANRAQLVGLAHIARIDDALNGGLLVRLTDGTEVEFSRRRALALRDRLSL